MMMVKKVMLITILAVMFLLVSACGEEPADPVEVTLPDELPAEVQSWIEASLNDFAAQTMEHEGVLYLLVTYGEKPTGGFEVEITGIDEEEDRLVVTAHFTEPGEDDIVTQALTYPYDLAMLDDPGLPVEFVATGAETEIPVK
jgi:hypothetical protein